MFSSAARVGAFVVLALALTLGIYAFLHGSVLAVPTTLVKADFADAQGQTLMASMNRLARAFQGVAGDPRFTRDLKSSVASMAVTAKRGEQIAANLQAVSARAPLIMGSFERAGRAAEGTMTQARAAL